MAETSLATLFAAVKQEAKNKPKTKPQRTVRLGYKKASATILDDKVVAEGDEWALGVNELADTIEVIVWRPQSRVLLSQSWQCTCGGHGTSRLGLFVKELHVESRCIRMRNVGRKFDPDLDDLPAEAQWLDVEHVSLCHRCVEDSWQHSAYQHTIWDDIRRPTVELVETCHEVLSQMFVRRAGSDIHGRREFSEEWLKRAKSEPGAIELASRPWEVNPKDEEEDDDA